MAGFNVFISYSTVNVDQATQLEQALEELGYDVWRDGDSIPGGSEWQSMIEAGLDAAAAVVVLWSVDSAGSKWVRRELIHADQRDTPIIPLILDDTPLNLMLKTFQAIDTRPNWDEAIKRLHIDLKNITSSKSKETTLGTAINENGPMSTTQHQKNGANRTIIVVALIGFAGMIFAAFVSIVPDLLSNDVLATTITSTPTMTTATLLPTITPISAVTTPTHNHASATIDTNTSMTAQPTNRSTDALFTLESLNAVLEETCPQFVINSTLHSMADEHLSDLLSYGLPQLTATPELAYSTSAGLTMDELAELRGYTGTILARVIITDLNTPPTVADVTANIGATLAACSHSEIGIASQRARGASKYYLVVIFGSG